MVRVAVRARVRARVRVRVELEVGTDCPSMFASKNVGTYEPASWA